MTMFSICHQEKSKFVAIVLYSAYPAGSKTDFVLTARIESTMFRDILRHDFQVCSQCVNKGCGLLTGISAVLAALAGLFIWIANGFKLQEWYVALLVFFICLLALGFVSLWVVNKFIGYRPKLDKIIRTQRSSDVVIFDQQQYKKLKPTI